MKYCYSLLTLLFIVFFTNAAIGQDLPCDATEVSLTNITPATCTNNGGDADVDLSVLTPSGLADPACSSGIFDITDNDGWFYFDLSGTATTATLDFSISGCGGCILGYAIYDGDCSTISPIANSCDIIDFTTGSTPDPAVITGLVSGSRIYIRVWETSNSPGTVNLDIQTGPDNDECINSLPISGIGCNYGATDTEPDAYQVGRDMGIGTSSGTQVYSPWTPDPYPYKSTVPSICESVDPSDPNYHWNRNNNAVWYTFTVAPSTPQPVSLQISNVVCTGGNSLLQMGVWSNSNSCDLALETFHGCATGIGTVTITDATLPPGNYYLLVDGASGAECEWVFESAEIFCSIFAGTDKGYCEGDDISVALGGTPSTNDPAPVITWTSSPASAISLIDDVNSANPIFTLNDAPAGTYEFYVQLDGSEPGCLSKDTIIVTVSSAIIASALSMNSGACTDDPITLTANGSGGSGSYSYEWDNTATSQSINVNPSATTEYFVTVTDGNGCSDVTSVSVDPTTTPPNSNLNLTADVNSVCEGGNVSLTLSNSEGGINYQLTINGMPVGSLIGGTGGSIIFGPYSISSNATFGLIASSVSDASCRLVLTDLAAVTVNQNPSVSIATSNLGACSEEPTTITATGSGGSGDYSYTWDNSLGSGAVQVVDPSVSTTYTVTVQDNVTGCMGSNNITVEPSVGQPNGDLDITINNNPICTGESTGFVIANSQLGVNYQLTLGGNPFGAIYAGTGGDLTINTSSLTMTTTYGLLIYSNSDSNCFLSLQDAVTIIVLDPPTSADAGSDQFICSPTTLTDLAATLPAGSLGVWTQVSGPTTVGFSDINDPNNQVSNLAIGTYIFNWEVSNSACTGDDQMASDQVSIFVGNIDVTPTTTAVSSIGGTDGSIALCVTGGTGPYTVNYTPTEGTLTTVSGACDANFEITGLSERCYSIVVEDINGCQWMMDQVCVDGPGCSTFEIDAVTVSDESCSENNDGSITITTSGGAVDITYTITFAGGTSQVFTTSNTSHTFTNLSAGTYTVSVEDSRACSISYSGNPVTVGEPDALAVTPTTTAVSSIGATDGSIALCVTGGTGPYTVNYTPTEGTLTTVSGACDANFEITGLSERCYSIVVEDINGCQWMMDQVCVDGPGCSSFVIDAVTVSDESCNENNDGSITITTSGGEIDITYTITLVGGASQSVTTNNLAHTFTGLTAGFYTISVEDSRACSILYSGNPVEVGEPAALVVTPTLTATTAIGGNDGAIALCVNGGTGPYTLNYTPTEGSSETVSGTCDANYLISGLTERCFTVMIEDTNGCQWTDQVCVPGPNCTDFNIDDVFTTNESCNENNDGSITIITNNGQGNLTYTITSSDGSSQVFTTSSTSHTFMDLSAGSYTIVVTDERGCNISYLFNPVIITEPNVLNASYTAISPSTDGGSDGSVNVCITGGTAPYVVNSTPAAVASTTQAGCDANFTIPSLEAGVYDITITDANGCVFMIQAVVPPPTCAISITQTSFEEPACNGDTNGTLTVTVSGNGTSFQYSVDNGPFTAATTDLTFVFSGLAAGMHTITVVDNFNCDISTTVTITEPEVITATYTTSPPSTIGGLDGAISACINGGTAPYTAAIVPDPGAVFTNTGSTADCENLINITGLPAGSYAITFTDANGCTFTIQNAVIPETQCADLQIETAVAQNVNCFNESDGQVTVSVTGGIAPYLYSINGGISFVPAGGTNSTSYTFTDLDAGTYTIFVQDASLCQVSTMVTVAEPTTLPTATVDLINPSAIGASDGQVCITPSGGTAPYTITANCGTVVMGAGSSCGGTYHIDNLPAGECFIELVDANGCTAQARITLQDPLCADFMLDGVSVSNYSCTDAMDGSVTITVTGGQASYTYSIDGIGTFISSEATFTFENLPEGIYTGITVTDNRGCEVSLAGGIAITNAPLLDLDFTTTSSCNASDGTINVTVTGGTGAYTYNWAGSLPNSPNLTDLAPGTYNLTVVDANGCEASTPITVAGSSLEISASIVSPDCNGSGNGIIDITVSNGATPYMYDWSGDLPSTEDQNLLSEGTYTVTVTDANGCTVSQPFTITRSDISVSLTPQGTCDGSDDGSINVTVTGGTGPFTYTWLPDIGNVENPTGLADGIYSLIVTDANGCEASGSATVEEFETPQVEAGNDVTINEGESTQLNASATGGTAPYQVVWTPSTGLDNPTSLTPNANPEQTTTYTVTITDANGCTASDQVVVNVEENPFVKIPSGFTPNNDGKNDTFGPVTNLDLDVTVFKIFNRWGQMIYDDPTGRWDGQFQSVDQPLGTYVYLIEYLDQNGDKEIIKGHVNLIR